MKIKIAVLTIEHRHGTDTTIHGSREEAEAAIVDFVDQWWDTEVPKEVKKPSDPAKRSEAYFEHVEGEFADITDHEIESEAITPPPVVTAATALVTAIGDARDEGEEIPDWLDGPEDDLIAALAAT